MAQIYEWAPGTYYNLETIVIYQGVRYKIIQAHQSEPRWEPPNTPALWGRLPEDFGGYQQPPPQAEPFRDGGNNSGYNPGYIQPGAQQPQQAPPAQGGYGDEKNWDQHEEQHVDIRHVERKQNWYDLTPERKKQLEMGGGLVAGLALLGGGYYAYSHHNKSEEEKKAHVWGLQNWLHEAEARTQAFYNNGPSGPTTWLLMNEGDNIPRGAIPGGEQDGKTLFICRGFYEGSLQVGKVAPGFPAVVGYGHKEIKLPKYEILVGDEPALRWVDHHGHARADHIQGQPVEGGHEADGTPLVIAKAHHHNSIVPGKASGKLDGALIPFANSEVEVKEYNILCYA